MLFLGMKKTFQILCATALGSLALAAPALADSSAIYQACGAGGSLDSFSKSELQAALPGVPADLDEYNGCSAQINAAIIAKATKNLSGSTGATGVKGARARLRTADADDLTTPAERKKLAASVQRQIEKLADQPLTATTDPSIHTAPGKTLASSTAASTPLGMVIGVIGLLLLLGADLFRRLGKMPRIANKLPWSGQSAGD